MERRSIIAYLVENRLGLTLSFLPSIIRPSFPSSLLLFPQLALFGESHLWDWPKRER
jgi:hypothetical protein